MSQFIMMQIDKINDKKNTPAKRVYSDCTFVLKINSQRTVSQREQAKL